MRVEEIFDPGMIITKERFSGFRKLFKKDRILRLFTQQVAALYQRKDGKRSIRMPFAWPLVRLDDFRFFILLCVDEDTATVHLRKKNAGMSFAKIPLCDRVAQ